MTGSFPFVRALADLGANINIMSYNICTKLSAGKLTYIEMSKSLEEKSLWHPKGVIEDISVKNKDLVFLADFVILNIEEDVTSPLL